jgi:hypothetical protein
MKRELLKVIRREYEFGEATIAGVARKLIAMLPIPRTTRYLLEVNLELQGTRKNKAPLTAKELAVGKFRLKLLELGKGEYAFLPPTKGVNAKLYTLGRSDNPGVV